jgi:CSLREA domain-containing protein
MRMQAVAFSRSTTRRWALCLCAALAPLAFAGGAQATIYTVTTTDDLTGNCAATPSSCSLRQAVNAASGATDADTIVVGAGTYQLFLANGQLVLTSTTATIEGAGAGSTRISGGDVVRILSVAGTTPDVTLRGLTLLDGHPAGSNNGGAISVATGGKLTVADSVLSSNDAGNVGGAIDFSSNGTGTFENTTFADNTSGSTGGAVHFNAPSTSSFTGVTFARNKAGNTGGAVQFNSTNTTKAVTTIRRSTAAANESTSSGGAFNFNSSAEPTFIDSTISGNTAANGGGGVSLNSNAKPTFTNTTISGNKATGGNGGGVRFSSNVQATLTNATIVGNTAQGPANNGGGIAVTLPASITVANTIVSANTAPSGANCSVALTPGGGSNIESANTCGLGGLTDTDPLLGVLAANGGPTDTHALLPGSPATDAGDPAVCPAADQRGMARQGRCDIGAYELAPPAASTLEAGGVSATGATLQGSVTPNLRATSYNFELGTTDAYGSTTPVQGAGAGADAVPVAAAVGDLSPSTTYHYRVVATSPDGTSRGADRTFTTANVPPVLTATMERTTFAVGPKPTVLSARKRATKQGSAFRYTLSESAAVTIVIARAAPGRLDGTTCRKPSRRLRKKRSCIRYVRVGALSRAGATGANRTVFSGRLGRKALRPGRHRATVTAVDAGQAASADVTLTFTIVRR